ncbi:hypothetical protein LTR85_012216 [Meristemomyces frigidus]|nr:hypothetical protein LTR85_012216 [Meristemomyces frigidus]
MLIQAISLALVFGYLLSAAYRLSNWHPISHIRGPWWTAVSSAWLQYHTLCGTQARATQTLHQKYGPVVRVAPNEVEIADGAALWPIYIKNGGFDKTHHYSMLDIDGHATVFSTIQNRKRAERLKVALPFFSSASVHRQVPMLEACARRLVKRLELDKANHAPVDLLDRCRCYSVDTTSKYVFGEAFGALDEDRLSIAPVVDNFVEVNLLFNIPRHLYGFFSFCFDKLIVKTAAKQADAKVDSWIKDAIGKNLDGTADKQKTYPGQLAAMGMPLNQVVSEGKDAIFGATDALGLSLSLILWQLVSDAAVHAALRKELDSNSEIGGERLQSLPVLSGIIKETMRISSTVPCKLPRITPQGGMAFDNTFIPGGVVVGIAPYMLHLNEKVFPQPHTFNHERWYSPTEDMSRDWMPFGKGARACMGRHLAMMQLCIALSVIVKSGVLEGASTVKPTIDFWEWYNVKVAGGKIEIGWREMGAE